MESSIPNYSPLRRRSLPPSLPRSSSLSAIEARRQSGFFGSFYNNLNTILEPDRYARRASTFEQFQVSRRDSISDTFVDESEDEIMQENQGYDGGDPGYRSRRDSYIPPVPRVPSIYARQNAGRGRGRGRGGGGARTQVQTRPPVSYDRQRNGDMLPLPDPLRSSPTVAGSGLTASASFNDLSHPNRTASGSHFPVSNGPSPRVSSYSSTISSRDAQFIRLPGPLYEVEQTMRPVTHLPQQNVESGFGTSKIDTRTHGDKVDDPKRPSPKHKRSIFGLRKSSALSSASSQPIDPQDPGDSVRPKGSGFQLRKTPSRVMNLDQVAHGAAPVTRDSQPVADVPTHGPAPVPQNAQPTAKRQRSRFQLRDSATQTGTPVASDKKFDHAELGHTASIEESMISKDFKSSVSSVEESLHKRQTNFGQVPSKTTQKVSRSLFGLKKTPTGIVNPAIAPSTNTQGESNGHLKASPRQYRSAMNLPQTSPTRIPTPVAESKDRYFSTPVLPSQKKENVYPRTHRLLGPISPSRIQGPAPKAIPKARTMGMLSNLTSTFSRSSTNLANVSSSSIASITRTAEPTTSVSNASATAEQSSFTPNAQHITEAQHLTWWCGRFTSLHDRFHGEMLEETMQDLETFRSFQDTTRFAAPRASDGDPKRGEEQEMYEPATAGIELIRNDEDRRVLRVFAHLKSLCGTDEARKSLFDFQQTYARMHSNDQWLPAGGTMEDKPPGWVSRMTNVIGRRNEKSGNQTAMGRRTGLTTSVFGNKRSQTNTRVRGNLN